VVVASKTGQRKIGEHGATAVLPRIDMIHFERKGIERLEHVAILANSLRASTNPTPE
jgi:hypothetical protein